MPDPSYHIGCAARSASGTGHWLTRAATDADSDLRKRLKEIQRRAESLHLEIAALRREQEQERQEAAPPTGSGPPTPWWAKDSNYSPNE